MVLKKITLTLATEFGDPTDDLDPAATFLARVHSGHSPWYGDVSHGVNIAFASGDVVAGSLESITVEDFQPTAEEREAGILTPTDLTYGAAREVVVKPGYPREWEADSLTNDEARTLLDAGWAVYARVGAGYVIRWGDLAKSSFNGNLTAIDLWPEDASAGVV